MKYALIGNPNSGKTTLYNQLTGSNQHVGNFPGVTIEKKEGNLKNHKDVIIVDLPGLYSLSPYSEEEVVSRDYLLHTDIDLIINIVDATNLERNLYLSLQLLELGKPLVIALNMMDEVRSGGDYLDIAKLSEGLKIPLVPISAAKNQGIVELLQVAHDTAKARANDVWFDFCSGDTHKCLHAVTHLVEPRAAECGIPARFAAIKVIEGDEPMTRELNLSAKDSQIIESIICDMENALQTDREAAMVDMRYHYIEEVCANSLNRHGETRGQQRTTQVDRLLTHRILAIPIFLALMAGIFWLTFGPLGAWISDAFAALIQSGINLADAFLTQQQIAFWLHSLLIDGIFSGVGSVLSFLPTIIILFLCLSILEDSGYMARVAFVMDTLLRKIGLSGRSFVPMIIGFGCSVPAILATRTLASQRDRTMTMLLVPFMSCSAKIPIYALFTKAFFPDHAVWVMIALYITGMLVSILCGLLLKSTLFRGDSTPFIMELPSYRLPSVKNVLLNIKDRAWAFVQKAFTIIFFASIIIWFLQSFDWHFNLIQDSSVSILASLGALLAPLFIPLGFGSWQAVTALITGMTAKETVLSTLTILMGVDKALLGGSLTQLFTPLTALSFLVFILLYTPCFATLAVIKNELGSRKKTALIILFQLVVAWIVAFLVYQIGSLILGI